MTSQTASPANPPRRLMRSIAAIAAGFLRSLSSRSARTRFCICSMSIRPGASRCSTPGRTSWRCPIGLSTRSLAATSPRGSRRIGRCGMCWFWASSDCAGHSRRDHRHHHGGPRSELVPDRARDHRPALHLARRRSVSQSKRRLHFPLFSRRSGQFAGYKFLFAQRNSSASHPPHGTTPSGRRIWRRGALCGQSRKSQFGKEGVAICQRDTSWPARAR